MKMGPLDTSSAQRLLLAAGMADLLVCFLIAEVLSPQANEVLRFQQTEIVSVGTFLAVALLYWIVTEIFLSGATLGRFALGLHMRNASGKMLPAGQRIKRCLYKVSSFGLTGLSPSKPPAYDRASGVRWFSEMADAPSRPVREWALRVSSGAHAGQTIRLATSETFRRKGHFKIGRDANWADLKLTREQGVSAHHCVLTVQNGQVVLRDYGRGGTGSSFGTFIHGQRVKKGGTANVGNADFFQVAEVRIDILR